MDNVLAHGAKKQNVRYERYNPWSKALKRHEASRIWRNRTARILMQSAADLPRWVKDNVEWESVALIYED